MGRRILLVTAVDAERTAVLGVLGGLGGPGRSGGPGGLDGAARAGCVGYDLLRVSTGAGELTCAVSGVGVAAAAACAATVLALDGPYDVVLSAGVGGGFAGLAGPGAVVLADRVVHADLGADSPEGFLALDALGLGSTAAVLDADLVARMAAGLAAGLAAGTAPGQPGGQPLVGTVLTVSTVTGTDERAADLAARHHPLAEAMEGAGVLAAATAHGLPFGELRAISNVVGRRDRSAWQLPRALRALGAGVAAAVREAIVP